MLKLTVFFYKMELSPIKIQVGQYTQEHFVSYKLQSKIKILVFNPNWSQSYADVMQ